MVLRLWQNGFDPDNFPGFMRRRDRLRKLYEGRSKQLHALVGSSDSRAYGRAITKYDRARAKWRQFRGWD